MMRVRGGVWSLHFVVRRRLDESPTLAVGAPGGTRDGARGGAEAHG